VAGYDDGFAAGWTAAMVAADKFGPRFYQPEAREAKQTRRKPTRKGVSNPKMSRALAKANKMGRKKAGGFKKGWNQGKIMRKAHQLRRKM